MAKIRKEGGRQAPRGQLTGGRMTRPETIIHRGIRTEIVDLITPTTTERKALASQEAEPAGKTKYEAPPGFWQSWSGEQRQEYVDNTTLRTMPGGFDTEEGQSRKRESVAEVVAALDEAPSVSLYVPTPAPQPRKHTNCASGCPHGKGIRRRVVQSDSDSDSQAKRRRRASTPLRGERQAT